MIPSQVPVGREEKEEKFLSPNACFDSGPQLANTVNEVEFLPSSNNILERLTISTSSPPRSKTRQNNWEGRGGWMGSFFLQQYSLDAPGLMLGCLRGAGPESNADRYSTRDASHKVEVACFSGLSAKLVLIF